MGMMTVRNIPEEVHNALKARAKLHNRSTEAEVRAILEEAVLHGSRIQIGNALTGLSKQLGLTNEDFDCLGELRANEPADPMRFE